MHAVDKLSSSLLLHMFHFTSVIEHSLDKQEVREVKHGRGKPGYCSSDYLIS